MTNKPKYEEQEQRVDRIKQADVQNQQTETALQESKLITSILYEISNAVNTTINLSDLYLSIHNSLKKVIEATNFFIGLYDAENDVLSFPYMADKYIEEYPNVPIESASKSGAFAYQVIKQNKRLFVDKSKVAELEQKIGNEIIGQRPIQWLGVPLNIRGKTIGSMVVQSYTNPNRYEQSDADLLSAVSHQVALAIERKESDQALRESEEKYREIIATLVEGYYEVDLKGNFTFLNNAMANMLGKSISELIGVNNKTYMSKNTQKVVFNCFNTVYRTKKASIPLNWELIRLDDGSPCYIEHSVLPSFDQSGNVVGFRGIAHDVTERKLAEQSLRESEEKFRLISEQSLLGISIFQDGVYKYVNDAVSKITEYSVDEMMGWHIEEFSKLIHPDDLGFVMNQFRKKQAGEPGYTANYIYRGISKSGKLKWIEQHSKTITYQGRSADLVTVIDITDHKKAEELLIQSEKMMSVGGLAAGMAHELNNPLGGMLQGIQNIQRRLSPDLESNHALAKEFGIDLNTLQLYLEKRGILSFFSGIIDSGKKAAEIILNMLQFSRKTESQLVPTDIVELVENVLELAGKDYDLEKKFDFRNILIVREFDSNLPLIPCNKTEIEQVILNLLRNAAHAMIAKKQKKPSQITLRLKIDGTNVRIEIEDNGPGVDQAIRKRIFEPFFTTKQVGEGTGLGLSVSYMIITNNHRGTIEVESEKDKGTKFIILLPVQNE